MMTLTNPNKQAEDFDRLNLTVKEMRELLMATERPTDCTKPRGYLISDKNERELLKATLIASVRQLYGLLVPVGIIGHIEHADEMGHWTCNRDRMKETSDQVFTFDDLKSFVHFFAKHNSGFDLRSREVLTKWLKETKRGPYRENVRRYSSRIPKDGAGMGSTWIYDSNAETRHLDAYLRCYEFCAVAPAIQDWFNLVPASNGYLMDYTSGCGDPRYLSTTEVMEIFWGTSTDFYARPKKEYR